MTTNKITTLSEFLTQSGAKYRVFDMGRQVTKIAAKDFADFELATKPYPQPFQNKALFGVVFWNPKLADKYYVWFLSFPLDEQGLLIQAARDEFLVMLLDRVGEWLLAAEDGKTIEGALKDSPYTFKPREDKMAAFNAQATQALNKPVSQYYAQAQAYFTGQTEKDLWQTLGMQGVADVAIRSHDDKALINTLGDIPEQPFNVLAGFLESSPITVPLVEVIGKKLDKALQQDDMATICICLRAVSNSPAQGLVSDMVRQVLQHSCSSNIEVLATISGRCWQVLKQQDLCQSYVEQLANNDAGQTGFSHLLADLLFIPTMRTPIMQALRSPNRSDALSKAMGEMFG